MKRLLLSIAAIVALAVPAIAQAPQAAHEGVFEPVKKASLSAPVIQELITDVLVKEGDTVKEGDIVVELRKDREEMDVQLSKKLIELKRFVARGQQRLFKEQMGSEERALEARTEVEVAELQLKAKQVALDEKTVKSPLSGIVVKKYKEVGESIAREEKLVDIINIDRVIARFYLPPNLRRSLKINASVEVKVPDLDGAAFRGNITFIDPRNDAASGKVLVWVEIDNPQHRISPGMRGLATFAP